MDAVLKIFASVIITLIVLRLLAQLLVTLSDFSDIVPSKPASAGLARAVADDLMPR